MAILNIIIFLLVFVAGGVLLQIFLSKRKNKWLGLILPIVCLLFSIIAVLSIPMYTNEKLKQQELSLNGTVIEETVIDEHINPVTDIGSTILQMIIVFVLYNIPTGILFVIYFACRENIRKNSQLEKMNIQDLE